MAAFANGDELEVEVALFRSADQGNGLVGEWGDLVEHPTALVHYEPGTDTALAEQLRCLLRALQPADLLVVAKRDVHGSARHEAALE